MENKVLVTGANGFVGKVLCSVLSKQNFEVLAAVRTNCEKQDWAVEPVGEIFKDTDWFPFLKDVNYVVHTAARVHIMNDVSDNPLEDFRAINTHATINLGKQAAASGVKRFIFISSIKVNGEATEQGKPFNPDDNTIPTDPYGLSKYEAEVALKKIARETGMEVVILRPPLVYGPGVKANFASMMKWVCKGLPLPLGSINHNKRSLVSVINLVDLIRTCIVHPNAANETFLVSDDEDVSTAALLGKMAIALNVPNRLVPIPLSWLNLAFRIIRKPEITQRLCGSLQLNITKTTDLLSWKPPFSSTECMKKTADAYLDNLNKKK